MPTSNRLVLFTGAGMGQPLGLPTTVGFADEVKSAAQPVTKEVIDYLGPGPHDIEQILSSLEGFTKDRAFAEYLLDRTAASNPTAFAAVRNVITERRAAATREVRRIKHLIFRKLESYDRPVAADLHFNLIQEVQSRWRDRTPSIFTTNYDLTFEGAVESK